MAVWSAVPNQTQKKLLLVAVAPAAAAAVAAAVAVAVAVAPAAVADVAAAATAAAARVVVVVVVIVLSQGPRAALGALRTDAQVVAAQPILVALVAHSLSVATLVVVSHAEGWTFQLI